MISGPDLLSVFTFNGRLFVFFGMYITHLAETVKKNIIFCVIHSIMFLKKVLYTMEIVGL